jgi:glutamine synthetase
LVLCEVLSPDRKPHSGNARAKLRAVLDKGADASDAWFGFEQEYTLYLGSRPLGFPSERRFPAAQGPYYCGVGADEVYGRELVDAHFMACLEAGLLLTGVNAEVMPGQWEFQVGGPGGDALTASDHLWLARWILYRLGEETGISATLDPKPVPGDWNGAGMHTNFSTKAMRDPGGMDHINAAVERMSKRIDEHLAAYGVGYEMRLTGHHETCRYDEFKAGISDRTASVRIPTNVASDGCGYLEDRRPNANACPYQVATVMLQTICEID